MAMPVVQGIPGLASRRCDDAWSRPGASTDLPVSCLRVGMDL